MYDEDDYETHYQHRRPNPNKPAVHKEGGIWWARVIDLNNDYHGELTWSHQEALSQAHKMAAMVHKQRLIAALGSQIAKTHEACS